MTTIHESQLDNYKGNWTAFASDLAFPVGKWPRFVQITKDDPNHGQVFCLMDVDEEAANYKADRVGIDTRLTIFND